MVARRLQLVALCLALSASLCAAQQCGAFKYSNGMGGCMDCHASCANCTGPNSVDCDLCINAEVRES